MATRAATRRLARALRLSHANDGCTIVIQHKAEGATLEPQERLQQLRVGQWRLCILVRHATPRSGLTFVANPF